MFNPFPEVKVEAEQQACSGYDAIIDTIRHKITQSRTNVITIECYPTVNESELLEELIKPLNPSYIVQASDQFYSSQKVSEMIQMNLTDDRVFGLMSHHSFSDFVDVQKQKELKTSIQAKIQNNEWIVIYGVGASLLYETDLLIYADLARWEIQNRYRSGEFSNWKADNFGEDPLRMVKRGYFFEWRVADKLKKQLFTNIDYFLDTHQEHHPVMIDAGSYFQALEQVARQPFRLVPFFDPGVWGGNWMQENFQVGQDKINLAWSFDGVPEENSLYLKFGDVRMEIPANNVVMHQPLPLLGERVYGRFGAEFPIRFDFLDTMGGGNLSLQVHPLTDYVQDVFGAHYTQDESYYIVEAEEEAKIYLGVKNGTDKEEMMQQLRLAETGARRFPDEDYIYKRPIKKHDHYSIPAGTIHSAGANSVVLEISATPNRFTFKLWDWERVGLDGVPRPVHLEHGEPNIVFSRDQDWVEEELANRFEVLVTNETWKEERTGLHESEFIETRRHTFSGEVLHETHGSVNVLNLVEGDEAVVESVDGSFAPFVVHYGETFIIPETVKNYRIKPHGSSVGKELITIKAFVR
ncbi:mannose-6-phosphate isomerase class I [Lederbergia galactosidilyticus]|uniref:class I mannose-6-phosphate isomerase n=1 Tax=Lederbergia galactosidilytica TaxID=217031 RepID=UPI001AE51E01|nr:class I mannose-6-phosphate isomerase [Lederbergia galactosidilytica]MBP1915487.1 mannose-6-phosphate isomerase class I [Lederbergia galactosidilytica]